jgi:acetoin utilization protein AcuC
MCRLRVVWDEALAAYDFGDGHPLAPERVGLAMALAESFGVFDNPGVTRGPARQASDERLRLVHDADYIAAVREAVASGTADPAHGLGGIDNPVFPGMHEAAATVVGAGVEAARAVLFGGAAHAASLAGGLHHAMPDAASGFCVYNDAAIAIAWLLRQGVRRVAYVDTDAHHGDGVQQVFYDDPRVLTISLHQDPRSMLFPGTGLPSETGGPRAPGSAVNVALPPGTGDEGWLRAFDAIVPPLVSAFEPDVLISQHGVDGHADDPLADLDLSLDGLRLAAQRVHGLAHASAHGHWVLLGGGGYQTTRVVPRAFAHLLAIASGEPIAADRPTPPEWRAFARERTGLAAPTGMSDGRDPRPEPFESGHDPADAVDRAILATRAAVSPEHGRRPHS